MSKEVLDRARQEIDAAWLAGDADAILAKSADDMIFMPPHEGKKTGKEEIGSWLRGFFKQFSMTELAMPEREVIVSGDWAFERSSYAWVIVPAGGGEAISDQVNFLGIWHREADGVWREVRAIWNSTRPIAGTQ